MCGDYRALNDATLADKYVMPTPEEIFAELGLARLFSSLDLRQGFNQIPILPAHQHKTAFWAGSRLMEWKFMPFGVKNAPAKFQRVMDETLQGLEAARCYIDDILVFSHSLAEHLDHLQQVFERLRRAGLKCHPGKCVLAVVEVQYLGHLVKPGTIEPQDSKVKAVRAIPVS